MTVIQKTIGRLPVNLGDYDSTSAYGKKNRVLLYGCEWESKVNNNTYAPAALNTTTGVITPDTTHWKLISGSYNTWLIDNGYKKADANNVKDGDLTQHEINEAVSEEIGDDSTPASIKGRIKTLETNVGEGGSVDERIAAEGAQHYLKSETYTKSEVNGMITTPDQEYVTVTATDQTTAVTDVLPSTGEPDTVYRVGNWDGNQYDATAYSEYAWNESTSQYIHLSTKPQIGEVFDISAYHATGGTLATYSDLNDAINGVNGGVPQSLQKGGMSVKFVQSSDNKYVQARCMAQNFTTDVTQWQGVDTEIKAGSQNIAESGAVNKEFGICEDIEIAVTNGVALDEVLQIGANKGETYKVKLYSTTLIDSNGISIHFRKGNSNVANSIIGNGSTVEVTPNNNCDNIYIERGSGGIKGTGDIKLNICSNNGVIPEIKKLQSDLTSEASRAEGVENTLQQVCTGLISDISNIDNEILNTDTVLGVSKELEFDVTTGVELAESMPLLLGKNVTYKVTLNSTPYIDSNGVTVYMRGNNGLVVYKTIGNGATVEMTPQEDVNEIGVSRYGTGIIGTGNVTLSFKPQSGELININTELQDLFDELGKDIVKIPVESGVALSNYSEVSMANGETYLITLKQTPCIDNNGISLHLRKGSSQIGSTKYLDNGATLSITLTDDCDNIWVERSATGIIGTGTVEIDIINKNSLIEEVKELKSVAALTGYISPSGNDNNDGSAAHPLLTINKALEKGFSTILVNAGVYSQSNIDLSLTKSSNIKIAALPNAYVTFYPKAGDYTRIETEIKTNGYTNVYQTSINSVSNNLKFAWQDGVDYVKTLISDTERHPLQRGKEYRLDSTKIIKCSSSSLQDALNEIDDITDNIYRYFFDSSNSILYYSRPENVDSSHPICIPIADKTFIKEGNANNGKTLELVGIDVRYVPINITGMISPRIINCSAKYAYAYGGIMWFNSKGTYIERCEAAGTQYGSNGDGFNASANGSYPAHNSSVLLVDCWGHDNNDDGYSCHQRCEGIIQGGLFEYNKKGGVCPAYGEKHLCYNVLSRRNYNGIYYIGTADDGGKYGQAICFGCVSKNNSQVGFRCDGTGNKLIAIGCKSISDVTSYKTPDSNSSIELTDCSSSGATTIKSGNIIVTNTTLVE